MTTKDLETIKNILTKSSHFIKVSNETSELEKKHLLEEDLKQIQDSLKNKNCEISYKHNGKNFIEPIEGNRGIIRIVHDKILFEKEVLEKIIANNFND